MKGKRLVRAVTAVLLLAMISWLLPSELMTIKAEAASLKDPAIVEDDSMRSGAKVTWDCVWFGSYPQSEVVCESDQDRISEMDNGIYKNEYVLVGSTLWDKIISAEFSSTGDATVDGVKYKRLEKSDAVNVVNGNSQYYNWGTESIRYFRYEPVKWRILQINGDDMFLLADRALDDQRYNQEKTSVTWENSTLRSWLNGYDSGKNDCGIDYKTDNFIDTAFSSNEKKAVETTALANGNNMHYDTEGGNETNDMIFLLSESDVCRSDEALYYGFAKSYSELDEGRRCQGTTYAKAMGIQSSRESKYTGNCCWWLRSPGFNSTDASKTMFYGNVNNNTVDKNINAVRPALCMNSSASKVWSYAGTVASDGTVNEVQAGDNNSTEKIDIAGCNVRISNCVYDGKVQKPKVTVINGADKLTESKDYTVTYGAGRKNVGKYKVTVKGKGSFTGTKTLYFCINPKATSISKLTAGNKSFQMSWKKVSSQATGYQIQYAENSKFTKNKKSAAVRSYKTITKTVSKLKAGTKYYVKVRTYKTAGKTTYYSSWSKYKTVKTK